jgi:hypothetical protein
MRKQLGVLLIGMAASIASLSAQGSGGKADQIVIIGCLQSGPQNAFTLKDVRSGRSYRIDADAESIGWHVGHELEIHGTLQVRGDEARVKADQVVFIATHCSSSGTTTR